MSKPDTITLVAIEKLEGWWEVEPIFGLWGEEDLVEGDVLADGETAQDALMKAVIRLGDQKAIAKCLAWMGLPRGGTDA